MVKIFSDQRGYSLLELVISLGIIGVLLVSCGLFFQNSLTMLLETEGKIQGDWLARKMMENVSRKIKNNELNEPKDFEELQEELENYWQDENDHYWRKDLIFDNWFGWEEYDYECVLEVRTSEQDLADEVSNIDFIPELKEYNNLLYIKVSVTWDKRMTEEKDKRVLETILSLS
ncbi:MAG: type IV pilus modification PilV family protein [Halanaerobiaceae bacterium]